MKILDVGGMKILKFELFEKHDFLEHCFTGKVGGSSKYPFESLNMGVNTGDDIEAVKRNYERVGKAVFKSKLEDFVLSNQVHKSDIAVVAEHDKGNGIVKEQKYKGVDGLLTGEIGPILSTVYADCTPLFFGDIENRIVGVAHAGWRGTVGKIGKNMVEKMKQEFNTDPKNIIVGIGSTIGPCCYEVKSDVANHFKESFSDCNGILESSFGGRYRLNLWEANRRVVREAGVLDCNIEVDNHCTNCNSELFYSYRRDSGVTGRMAAMIALKY